MFHKVFAVLTQQRRKPLWKYINDDVTKNNTDLVTSLVGCTVFFKAERVHKSKRTYFMHLLRRTRKKIMTLDSF